jgi:hypothetical protein
MLFGKCDALNDCHPEQLSSAKTDESVPKDPDTATALLTGRVLFHHNAEFSRSRFLNW